MSLPFGVVTISEAFDGQLLSSLEYSTVVERTQASLQEFEDKHHIREAIANQEIQVIGTSGTVTVIGAVHLKLPRYNRSAVDGIAISAQDIDFTINKIKPMGPEGRCKHPCIGQAKSDLTIAGCAIIEALTTFWPISEITVADRGIREGILLDMMHARRVKASGHGKKIRRSGRFQFVRRGSGVQSDRSNGGGAFGGQRRKCRNAGAVRRCQKRHAMMTNENKDGNTEESGYTGESRIMEESRIMARNAEGNMENYDGRPCVAAMDLGTNSNRLLIADTAGNAVYRDVKHVALGEGLAESGKFCRRATERAICSFMDFAEMLKLYNVRRYRAIATAACRMSANTAAFRAEVKRTSGEDIEVISEYEEARLTLLGARLNAQAGKKYLLVYDLGGGSTEVTLATTAASAEIMATVSVPLGARNATEMFGLANYNEAGAKALEEAVLKYLEPIFAQTAGIDFHGQAALVATSSTPLRLVSLIKKMPKYDKFASDGVTVATADLDRVIGEILPLSYAKRAESVYIGPQRAKIFVAALVIFRTIFRALGEAELTASLKSAQEASVAELAAEEDTGDAAGALLPAAEERSSLGEPAELSANEPEEDTAGVLLPAAEECAENRVKTGGETITEAGLWQN